MDPPDPVKNPAAVELGRLGGQKGGQARARKLSPAERSDIASRAAKARWERRDLTKAGGPEQAAYPAPSWNIFSPRLEILPPPQRALWTELREAARHGFVLYGGTAIALRLGHRQSVDFDFFTGIPFDHGELLQRLGFLQRATVLQEAVDTLTCSIDPTVPGQSPVRVSFFRVGTGRVWEPEWTRDGTLLVASMGDLLAHKLKVILQRLEKKDYLDIHAMITGGQLLEDGLAGARALFGRVFQPAQALKALTWFQGGDLQELPARIRTELIAAAARVADLPPVPEVRRDLGGSPR